MTNSPDPPPAREVADIETYYRCRRCQAVLGSTTPTCLRIDAVEIRCRCVLTCLACGHKQTWRPPPAREVDDD